MANELRERDCAKNYQLEQKPKTVLMILLLPFLKTKKNLPNNKNRFQRNYSVDDEEKEDEEERERWSEIEAEREKREVFIFFYFFSYSSHTSAERPREMRS